MLFVSLITTLDLVETVYSGDCLLSTELSDAYRLVGREKIHFTEKLFSMSLLIHFGLVLSVTPLSTVWC